MAKWYEDYLKSEHWQRKRLERLMAAEIEGSYIRCQSQECRLWLPLSYIDIHHKTYKRLHNERLTDLAVLCRACHANEHGFPRPIWWESVKSSGSEYASEGFLRGYRDISTIGETMFECLQYHNLDKAMAEGA